MLDQLSHATELGFCDLLPAKPIFARAQVSSSTPCEIRFQLPFESGMGPNVRRVLEPRYLSHLYNNTLEVPLNTKTCLAPCPRPEFAFARAGAENQ